MANTVSIRVTAKDDATGTLKKVRGAFGDVAKIAGGFVLGQGILAAPGQLMSFSNAASDLAESQSKVEVVFGDSSRVIDEFATTSARAFGVSKEEALAAAGAYGNLFTTMGLGQDTAADMSVEMVGLASDLASFNNIGTTEALDKIRSGLVGEIEPLRALGVSFTAAQVKAKALELGLADASGEVSEGAKVQARYALILEQTTAAQGDFARTSDGAANQQRIMAAQMADLKAQIGTAFLPAMLAIVTAINDDVIPAFRAIGKWINEDVEPALRKFWEEYGPGIKRFWEEDVKPAFEDFLAISKAIVDFVSAHWPEIEAVVRPVFDQIILMVETTMLILGNLISFILNVFRGDWSEAWQDLKDIFVTYWDYITGTLENFAGFLTGLWGVVATAAAGLGTAIGQGIMTGISNIWDSVISWLKDKLNQLLDVGIDIPGIGKVSIGSIGGVISGGFNTVGGVAGDLGIGGFGKTGKAGEFGTFGGIGFVGGGAASTTVNNFTFNGFVGDEQAVADAVNATNARGLQ